MTNLIERFVDFATGEVTATVSGTVTGDVDNSVVTTDEISLDGDEKIKLGDTGQYEIFVTGSALTIRNADDDETSMDFDSLGRPNFREPVLFHSDITSQGFSNINMNGADISNLDVLRLNSQDVTAISSPSEGWVAYHDGSGSETEGPAFFDGDNWISTVDGTTITNP